MSLLPINSCETQLCCKLPPIDDGNAILLAMTTVPYFHTIYAASAK